jgi:hypothetical protein
MNAYLEITFESVEEFVSFVKLNNVSHVFRHLESIGDRLWFALHGPIHPVIYRTYIKSPEAIDQAVNELSGVFVALASYEFHK